MKPVILWLFLLVACPSRVAADPHAANLGRLRLELDGSLEATHVQRLDSSNPDQHPQGRLRIAPAVDLWSGARFEVSAAGLAGGTPHDPRGPGLFDWGHSLQDISPSLELEEAYLDVSLRSLDLRAGLQKFAWGRLDALQPNDFLNPEKFYDPILEDEDERKIGIPALSATIYLPTAAPLESLRLTGVWAPVVVPAYFPDIDERWYPPLARPPAQTVSDGFIVKNSSRFRNGELPSRDLGNSGGAGRLSGLIHGVDVALYVYDGFDTAPALEAAATGFVTFQPLNPGCAGPPQPECFDVRSEIEIFPIYRRIRAIGADFASNFLGATVRAEVAFVKDRPYPRAIRDVIRQQRVDAVGIPLAPGEEQAVPVRIPPVQVRRDGVEWGFGGDYLFFGDTFFLVQMNQTIVLDNDVDLLVSDSETRVATTLRRSFLSDRLEAELIGFYGMQGVYGLAHPRITYDVTDSVDVRIGAIFIAGHERSMLGQYRENDETYVRLRFTF